MAGAETKSRRGRVFPQYDIDDLSRIWYRVVCVNDEVPGTSKSFLGPTGHIERMTNVYVGGDAHLFAASLHIFSIALYTLQPYLPFSCQSARRSRTFASVLSCPSHSQPSPPGTSFRTLTTRFSLSSPVHLSQNSSSAPTAASFSLTSSSIRVS